MHLQTLRPRESSFDKYLPPIRHLSIDTAIKIPSSEARKQQQQQQRLELFAPARPNWCECASYDEIRSAIFTGIAPSQLLYTSPTVSPASLRLAARLGVNTVAVDSVEDIMKIKLYSPQAQLVFRIHAGDLTAPTSALSFAVETANELLEEAAAQNLKVVGVSFHVASLDLAAFRRAIDASPLLVDTALEVERKLKALGVSADLISSSTSASEHPFSPESPLAFPNFNEMQVAHNAFALVS